MPLLRHRPESCFLLPQRFLVEGNGLGDNRHRLLVGILLLFLYGMPYQVRTGGVIQFEADNPRDQNQIELERWYDRLGWLGLVYVALGTFYQVAANPNYS